MMLQQYKTKYTCALQHQQPVGGRSVTYDMAPGTISHCCSTTAPAARRWVYSVLPIAPTEGPLISDGRVTALRRYFVLRTTK